MGRVDEHIMDDLLTASLKAVIRRYPAVVEHLSGRARWIAFARDGEYKTYDYFLATVQRLVKDVYKGNMGGEFIDIMANLIQGQITQAYQIAWQTEGGDGVMPDYLKSAAEDDILRQYDYVDQFYRDIADARIDQTPIDPLLARAALWANRYNESYSRAVGLILAQMGGRLAWKLGETEEHCDSCFALNGIVAFATEWEELDVHPQGAPNGKLQCGGWKCDCSLSPTDKRRSPKAYTTIMDIVSR